PSSHYSPREPARASGGSGSPKSSSKRAPPSLFEAPRKRAPHPRRMTRRECPHAPPAARPLQSKRSDRISARQKGGYGRGEQGRGTNYQRFRPLSRVRAPPIHAFPPQKGGGTSPSSRSSSEEARACLRRFDLVARGYLSTL
ncbi:uncharacterized protein SCHCODRAFT_02507286, partial [Schizophyllum commune H4-8]|uniref:uncharacterized protein n=1 Tax=Schizophyllum commune (strain H4-8 / FGSC 9210) TaxID=578458 RepID=UPI00215DF06C